MTIEHIKEGSSGQPEAEYSNLIQMSEDRGEAPSAQNPENPLKNSLDTRISRRKFMEMLGIGGAGVTVLSHPLAKRLEAATTPLEKVPEKKEVLTTREVLAKLIPEDPINTYVDVRDVNLVKDPSGNILGFDVLGNKDRFTQDSNKWRTFNSSKSNGVFSEFGVKVGDFSGEPSVFYRDNGKTFVAVEGGVAASNSGVMIMDESSGESRLIPLSPAYMPSKAVFPESAILAFSRHGEVALVNMKTNEVKVLPIKFDYVEQGAVIGGARIQRISEDSVMGAIYTPGKGSYGIAEVKFNFSDLSLNGQPEVSYRDKKVDSRYAYVGASGQVEEVYLYNSDTFKLFIADHTTKQKKDEYKISGLYSIKVDQNEVVAMVLAGTDIARKVWPRGVNPELNPERVTTVNIQEGFDDGTAVTGGRLGIPEEGYINGELYDVILTVEKSVVAVKRQPNPDKSFDKYMLVNGIPQSYEAPPATKTPISTNTSTPSATPTVTQALQQVFMPVIKRAHNLFGW